MIEDYKFGHVKISGTEYNSDVICHAGQVTDWWRETGHKVSENDIQRLMQEKPAVIVIGTGAYGLMRVPRETRKLIEDAGIELVTKRTAEATKVFNQLQEESVDVAIAMHLTC